MAVTIERDICTACGDCEPLCPTESIYPHKGLYAVNADTCTECDGEADAPKCMEVCMEDDCIVFAA
ncbi:4Fe-4S binding protein [Varunaivibrio sulfuroxidans]|uniref:4Fe-4S binding protein n=1 Tax=Varunaivibrio sulfuroxidans TaxID=1773489 RepID=A0A4R3J8P6_9PROT|nr:4Fe-4S binding protein [Varunaivibrio sulfuroxidans]TCS61745.1 4Fe-4S binding protein [Varunaivibrio sulfuroxidans]WES32071.1 4Fe-4S binding protein [Varunaivibrio sulfuroxidans]